MPRKIIRAVEDVDSQVDPAGELPAHTAPQNGAGGNAGGGCPDGKFFNGTTRECEDSDTGRADQRSISEPVAKSSSSTGGETGQGQEEVGGDTVSDVEPAALPDENEGIITSDLGGDTLDTGDDEATDATVTSNGPVEITGTGGDTASEHRRQVRYTAKVTKAEMTANKAIKAQEARIRAKQLKAQELKVDAEILRAREAVIPKLSVAPAKGTFAKGKVSAVEAEVSKPSAWFRAVQRNQNVSSSYLWNIDKEKLFENYNKRGIRSYDGNDNEIFTKLKGGEAVLASVSGPDSTSQMRIMSEQVLVLPNGKVVTPIRQFCETKVLPAGTDEALFYDFGDVQFSAIADGNTNIATATPESTPVIRTSSTTAGARGTRITIGYTQTETSPVDIIASANRAFALESINDESKRIFSRYNDDTANAAGAVSPGPITAKKAQGGGVKTARWVAGNTGGQITADSASQGAGVMKYVGLLNAKGVIQDEGLDDSNLITYTTGKAIRDLTLDADLDSYIGFSRPAIITEATIERVAGTNLVRSSATIEGQATPSATQATRSVMFIPNVAFGLVTGRDLTMEAQRRNEFQVIHLTGTQRVDAVVKNIEATCRVSHD